MLVEAHVSGSAEHLILLEIRSWSVSVLGLCTERSAGKQGVGLELHRDAKGTHLKPRGQ